MHIELGCGWSEYSDDFNAQKMVLVEKLKEISSTDRNLPSIRVPITLFLVFSDLYMDAVDDLEVEAHNSSTDICASNTPLARYHHTVNMPTRTWIDSTN